MFHEGELSVQRRAGVAAEAERVGRIIGDTVPAAFAAFLAARDFVIVATRDGDGAVTASILTGVRGFARAMDERSVRVEPAGGHRQRVFADVAADPHVGMLAIDFTARRRIRVNGMASRDGDALRIVTNEVYGNCPQYIARHDGMVSLPDLPAPAAQASLTEEQRTWIESAATFFIATAHPGAGADASHRGGDPGFVRADERRIAWPDYSGNNMFTTLGNLEVNPRCGLLFLDFDHGRTLQIGGRASIAWDGQSRRIQVEVETVE
jgi:predicted pyridoxine 5'-phosphate oxidase superfamily flavin-nucleotide-binding protein